MKHSLSFYIIMLVIKLKGLKKTFSQVPIDYRKVRKDDIHSPKNKFFSQVNMSTFKVAGTSITQVENKSDRLIIFIHGGAFISGPAQHHWDTIEELYKRTGRSVWMCDYPKAPEHQIQEISDNIDQVYVKALEKYKGKQITLIGDSVGGTIITALVQRLIINKMDLPNDIIIVCPVMDASLSNPDIDKVDVVDPILSKAGVLSAKRMCAGEMDLKNAMISPLNGSFKNFPNTMLFIAENDVTYPDQKLAIQKMIEAHMPLTVIDGKGMPHVWPFLPVMKEGKAALNKIIDRLNK